MSGSRCLSEWFLSMHSLYSLSFIIDWIIESLSDDSTYCVLCCRMLSSSERMIKCLVPFLMSLSFLIIIQFYGLIILNILKKDELTASAVLR